MNTFPVDIIYSNKAKIVGHQQLFVVTLGKAPILCTDLHSFLFYLGAWAGLYTSGDCVTKNNNIVVVLGQKPKPGLPAKKWALLPTHNTCRVFHL